MTTQQTLAALAAAYPSAKIGADTLAAYVHALADIPPEELQPATRALALTGRWFPTISEIRTAVVEARLQLPGPEQAWELAVRWAHERPTVICPACVGGLIDDPDGAPVRLDRTQLDALDETTRRYMAALADRAEAQPMKTCPACDGAAELPNEHRPALPTAVKAALDHVGGGAGVREADNLAVVRAQFLKAYGRQRDHAVVQESLGSAGLGQLAGALPRELEPGRD